jgi:hypothetical protein
VNERDDEVWRLRGSPVDFELDVVGVAEREHDAVLPDIDGLGVLNA